MICAPGWPSAVAHKATAADCLIEFNPATFVPVAASFVLPPPVSFTFVLSPSPIIRMKRNAEFGTVIVTVFNVPTITLAIASDFR